MMYALFKNGTQISKAHVAKEAVVIEAYEFGCVIDFSADFVGDKSGRSLMDGYEIKPLSNDEASK